MPGMKIRLSANSNRVPVSLSDYNRTLKQEGDFWGTFTDVVPVVSDLIGSFTGNIQPDTDLYNQQVVTQFQIQQLQTRNAELERRVQSANTQKIFFGLGGGALGFMLAKALG